MRQEREAAMAIELEEAVNIIRVSMSSSCSLCKEEGFEENRMRLPLKAARGYILAEDILAPFSQPPFRRSAMDGYAMRYSELDAESIPVENTICAGCTDIPVLKPGTAVRIMTGGALPAGAEVVVRQEDVEVISDTVTPAEASYRENSHKEPGIIAQAEEALCRIDDIPKVRIKILHRPSRSNISEIGEDFVEGTIIAERGWRLSAGAIGCLAAAGIEEVSVYKKMRVALVATGDELVPCGYPLQIGQIYDSSERYISSRLEELGCSLETIIHVQDDKEKIADAILTALKKADFLITTGGVSVGIGDLLEAVVRSLGGKVLFHGIRIKPGMPTMFSLIDGIPVLSLSGNPFSAWAMFEVLFPGRDKIYTTAKLGTSCICKRPSPKIVRGSWNGAQAVFEPKQKNGTTFEMSRSNCLIFLPEGEDKLTEGTDVKILLL